MEIETFYTGMDVNELAKKMKFTAKNNDAIFSAHIVEENEEGLDEVTTGFEIKKDKSNYFDLDDQDYDDIESLECEIPARSILIVFKNELHNDKFHYAYDDKDTRTIYVSSINILGYLKNENGLIFVKNPESELSLESETLTETPIRLELKK